VRLAVAVAEPSVAAVALAEAKNNCIPWAANPVQKGE